LERCSEPEDWLRREIEMAMDQKCNIVPLMMEGFDFGSPTVKNALSGKLVSLNHYNGLRLVSDYFFEAMERLRNRYLNIALEEVHLHPLSKDAKELAETQKTEASKAETVNTDQLREQEKSGSGSKYMIVSNSQVVLNDEPTSYQMMHIPSLRKGQSLTDISG